MFEGDEQSSACHPRDCGDPVNWKPDPGLFEKDLLRVIPNECEESLVQSEKRYNEIPHPSAKDSE
jgi:hypothetical protein